jgi:hypothetical protein
MINYPKTGPKEVVKKRPRRLCGREKEEDEGAKEIFA